MDFKNLQRELFETKLKMGEYFKKTFDILKIFLKENKLCTSLFAIGNIWMFFSNAIVQNILIKMQIAGQVEDREVILEAVASALLISSGVLLVSLCLGLLRGVIYTKAAYKIEGRESEYKFKNVFFKYLTFIGIYLLFCIVIGVIIVIMSVMITIFSLITKNFNSRFLKYIMYGVYFIIVIVVALNILYFMQTLYIRNIKVLEAFKYNLALSKKNRLRILIPTLIITAINLVFVLPFSTKLFVFMPSYVVFLIAVVCGFISSILGIAGIIMNTVIFLNVEYDYLKRQAEEKEKLENFN